MITAFIFGAYLAWLSGQSGGERAGARRASGEQYRRARPARLEGACAELGFRTVADTDFQGADLHATAQLAVSAEHCCALCAQLRECEAFTFLGAGCWLKAAQGPAHAQPPARHFVSGVRMHATASMPDSTGGGPATPAPSEPLGGGVVCFGDCLTNQLMARAGHVWRREKARLALLAGEHALPPAPEPSVRPARPSADAIGLAGEAAQLSARAAARAAATVDWARLTPSVARNALLLTWAVRGGCGEERAPVPSATADDADDADERADDAPPDGGDGDAAGGREVHFGRIYGDGDVPAQLLRARVWTAAHPAEPRVCVRRALLRGLDGGRRHAYKLPLESGGRPPRFGPLVVFRAPAWGAARVSLVALGPAAGAAEAAAVAAEAAGQRASAVLQPCAVRADAAIVAAAAAADTASERARLPAVERAKRWARWARALGALPGRVPMVSAPTPSADARDLAARPPRLASARPARAQDTRGFAEGAATSECGELYRLFSPMPGFASGSRLGRFGAPRAAGGAGEAACARAAASSRDWFVAELGPVRVVSVSASRALHGGAEQATWLRLKLARLAALARAERPWTILLAGARLPPPPRANGSDEAEAASEALGQLVAAHAHHFHLALTAGSQGYERTRWTADSAPALHELSLGDTELSARRPRRGPPPPAAAAAEGSVRLRGDGAYLRIDANVSTLVAQWVCAGTGNVLDELVLRQPPLDRAAMMPESGDADDAPASAAIAEPVRRWRPASAALAGGSWALRAGSADDGWASSSVPVESKL